MNSALVNGFATGRDAILLKPILAKSVLLATVGRVAVLVEVTVVMALADRSFKLVVTSTPLLCPLNGSCVGALVTIVDKTPGCDVQPLFSIHLVSANLNQVIDLTGLTGEALPPFKLMTDALKFKLPPPFQLPVLLCNANAPSLRMPTLVCPYIDID